MKKVKFINSIRFKLTITNSAIILLFTLAIVLIFNVYNLYYFRNDPELASTHNEKTVLIEGRRFQLFTDLTQLDRERIKEVRLQDLRQIQIVSILSTIPITFASFFIGYFIAGRFLRPIDDLREQFDELKANKLGKKIPKEFDDEIGKLIDSFNDMSIRLEKSFSEQIQFVQDASHELKTPLAIIYTNLEVILDCEDATKKEYKEAITYALSGISRINDLTEDLLALTKPCVDKQKKVDIAQIVKEQIKSLETYAKEKNVELSFNSPSGKFVARLNKSSFGRAIFNLIENGIKYSRSAKNPKVEINLSKNKNSNVIKIIDNGTGIPKAELKNIFQRFYRIDKSRSRKEGGFGLGLAITKKIVEENGGKISVVSKKGKTVFNIVLEY